MAIDMHARFLPDSLEVDLSMIEQGAAGAEMLLTERPAGGFLNLTRLTTPPPQMRQYAPDLLLNYR